VDWKSESDKLVLVIDLLREIQIIMSLMGQREASLDIEEAITKLDYNQNRLWIDNY